MTTTGSTGSLATRATGTATKDLGRNHYLPLGGGIVPLSFDFYRPTILRRDTSESSLTATSLAMLRIEADSGTSGDKR
jgi:hypothetical protein